MTTLFKLISVFVDVMTASIQMQLQNIRFDFRLLNLTFSETQKQAAGWILNDFSHKNTKIFSFERKSYKRRQICRHSHVNVCEEVAFVALICISLKERMGHSNTQHERR